MLLQRVITAVTLTPLLILAILWLPLDYFSLLVAIIVLIAAYEWCKLVGMESPVKQGMFLLSLFVPMLGLHFWTQILEIAAQVLDWTEIRTYSGALEWLVIPPVLFWILVMLLIRNAPTGLLELTLKTRYQALIGWFVLLSAWLFLYRLRAFYDAEMFIYFLLLIWSADIAAYFSGKKWGTVKLSPEISPGKTVQGMYGALAAAAICGIGLNVYLKISYGMDITYGSVQYETAFDFILLSVLTVLLSIYGDLFFSLAKRRKGVKDSGALLPGHGGMLDRIDSIIAAIPFFYAGVYLIYWAIS